MNRYALIDLHSGYVAHVTDAESPQFACALALLELEMEPSEACEWHEVPLGEAAACSGFAVHIAPAGFDVDDKQNAKEVAAVDAMPSAGCYIR